MTSLAHTQSNIQLGNQVKVWFRATTNFITVCWANKGLSDSSMTRMSEMNAENDYITIEYSVDWKIRDTARLMYRAKYVAHTKYT